MATPRHSRYTAPAYTSRSRRAAAEEGFTCIRCGLFVTCASLASGVQNRNHCPCCLYSRHLDWRVAGDRLSACHAPMAPIGLTTKRSRNKYARERDGELMIIHRCTACGKLVINRIAADDSAATLVELFEASCEPGAALRAELAALEIAILTSADAGLLRQRLFGCAQLASE